MAGIILVLAVVLVAQQRDNLAYANTMQSVPAGAVDVMLMHGGTGGDLYDVVWVLYRRPITNSPGLGQEDLSAVAGAQRLSLVTYRVSPGGKSVEMISARDITFDVEVPSYQTTPSVVDIKRQLEDEAERRAEKKRKEEEKRRKDEERKKKRGGR
ncbi:MAG: hypothetical protein ACYTAF_10160 [Planctomycetota bacterium]